MDYFEDVYLSEFLKCKVWADAKRGYLAKEARKDITDVSTGKGMGWKNSAGYQSLQVKVLDGNLQKVGLFLPTTYLLLTVDSRTFRTKSSGKTLIPEWNEVIQFDVLDTSQTMEVLVMQEGLTGESFLGRTCIPFEVIAKTTVGEWRGFVNFGKKTWHRLLGEDVLDTHVPGKPGEGPIGEIRLQFAWNKAKADHSGLNEIKIDTASVTNVVRGLVSKKKKRFKQDGFDLDLTYITPRVIAMGFPSSGLESQYRNPMKDVRRFFEQRHKNCYMVYNLCSERDYDPKCFYGRVKKFPFDDHNPCPYDMLEAFCIDIRDWMAKHPQNICAIHCKAGKGRTGLMITCHILYSGLRPDAASALYLYGMARTFNKKGVTIPSQRRFVGYFDTMLHRRKDKLEPLPKRGLFLKTIKFEGLPYILTKASALAFNVIIGDLKFASKKLRYTSEIDLKAKTLVIELGRELPVFEDVKFVFYNKKTLGQEKLFQCWINTRFIEDYHYAIPKLELDKGHKDKKHKLMPEDMKVHFYFEKDVDIPFSVFSQGMDRGNAKFLCEEALKKL